MFDLFACFRAATEEDKSSKGNKISVKSSDQVKLGIAEAAITNFNQKLQENEGLSKALANAKAEFNKLKAAATTDSNHHEKIVNFKKDVCEEELDGLEAELQQIVQKAAKHLNEVEDKSDQKYNDLLNKVKEIQKGFGSIKKELIALKAEVESYAKTIAAPGAVEIELDESAQSQGFGAR